MLGRNKRKYGGTTTNGIAEIEIKISDTGCSKQGENRDPKLPPGVESTTDKECVTQYRVATRERKGDGEEMHRRRDMEPGGEPADSKRDGGG